MKDVPSITPTEKEAGDFLKGPPPAGNRPEEGRGSGRDCEDLPSTVREPAEGEEGLLLEEEAEALPPAGVEGAGLLLEVVEAEGLRPEVGAGSLPLPLRRRAAHAALRSPRGPGR